MHTCACLKRTLVVNSEALREEKLFLLNLLNSSILHADKCEVIWGRHTVLIPSDLLVDTVIYTRMWL